MSVPPYLITETPQLVITPAGVVTGNELDVCAIWVTVNAPGELSAVHPLPTTVAPAAGAKMAPTDEIAARKRRRVRGLGIGLA